MKAVIIEDDPMQLKFVTVWLNDLGVTTVGTTSAIDGLQYIVAESPDFVMTDLHMPDIPGFILLELIRTNVAMAGKPVVLMTSSLDPDYRRRAQENGAEFLLKPITAEKLKQLCVTLNDRLSR